MSDIKILVATHRDNIYVPDNPLLYPIQVGTAAASSHFEGMLHDDDNPDNISDQNARYCELTALYWAWKNLEADYIGLYHYRRYLVFSSDHYETNRFGDIKLETNDDATLEVLGCNESTMRDLIEQYDLIVPEKGRFKGDISLYEQYRASENHYIEDLDAVLQIIGEKHPDMMPAAHEYLEASSGYFCNMFIMRKELFDGYCTWLFDILREHEKRCDASMYNPAAFRVSGYLAERLSGIYFTWLQQQGARTCELQRTLFADVSRDPLPEPAFPDTNQVAVVLAANDRYVPYVAALLESIKDHASSARNYDILVLSTDISERNQRRLKQQVEQPNISLRFFNASFYMRGYEALHLYGHFSVETYYRLLMQDIMPAYSKALYLDSDMIVMRDIAELYDTDVAGYLMAAVKDPDTAGLYNGYYPDKKAYMDDVLRIADPYSYFQAGVILFNLDEFRKSISVSELMEFAGSNEWELLDQDVLNYFGQGRTKFLPMEWNVMTDLQESRIKDIISRAPKPLYDAYMEARKNPAIIHYAGPEKPWHTPDSDFAEAFWHYSRRTVFYEAALKRCATERWDSVYELSTSQKIKAAVWDLGVKVLPYDTPQREAVRKVYRLVRRIDEEE